MSRNVSRSYVNSSNPKSYVQVPGGAEGWGSERGGEGASLDEADIESADPAAPAPTAHLADEVSGGVKQSLSSPSESKPVEVRVVACLLL